MKKKLGSVILAVWLALVILVVAVAASLTISQTITSNGSITATIGLAVYSDPAATVNCTSVAWGQLAPGSSANRTVYIKNVGDSGETLTLGTNSWSPAAAAQYISVTWNLEGCALAPGQVAAANLCLSVSSDVVGISDFGVNLVVMSNGN